MFPLEDGSALKLTTALYYSPLGKVIQKEGVAPDVLVESAEDMLDNEAHNAIDRTFATIELPENTRAKTPLPTREQLEKMASNKIDLQREKALEVLKALTRGGTTK